MDRYPVTNDPQPEIELWEPDRFSPEPEPYQPGAAASSATGRQHGLFDRIARSTPAAVAGTFLVAAVAFGAVGTALTSTASDASAERDGKITVTDEGSGTDDAKAANDDGETGDEGGKDGGDAPTGEMPDDKAADTEPTGGDKPADDDKPADEPGVKPLELALHLNDTYIKVDWTGCDVDGFRYYKVVRSTDATPAWPLGDADQLVAAIEDPATTVLADGTFGAGKTYRYRVFGLDADGVACVSSINAIAVPAPAPKSDPEPKDAPKEDPKPDDPKPDDPATGTLGLSVSIKDGKPYVDWTECGGSFDYYKVIRSSDSTVTWPKGEGDSGVTAVGPDGKTAAWDGDAPAGKKLWYRVFCVTETDGGYKVVGASAATAVVVPVKEPEPEPDPVELGLEVTLTDDGAKLDWEACGSDVFVAYKIVRSHSPNPSYLPGTDGTQVIGVIENAGTTAFVDGDVEAGQAWYYRVQAIGWMNDHKILLGQTAAIAVTVE